MPAIGSIILIEQEDGRLGAELEFNIDPRTDDEVAETLRDSVYGLMYQLTSNKDYILNTGAIFRNGISIGANMRIKPKEDYS